MIHFEYKPREYVSSVNLETLEKAVNTLEQGHKEAIKMQNELYGAIDSLDMDESENDFKLGLTDNIQSIVDSTIENNFRNATSAINKLIVEQGNLLKNPLISAKVRANQKHKEYEKVVKGSNISSDRKDYLLEKNSYRNGAYDENGEFKIDSGWEEQVTMYNEPNFVEILKQAASLVAEQSGSYVSPRYIDANGNITSDINKMTTIDVFDTTTGSYKRKSKNDILTAFFSIIDSTPELKGSVQQTYDVAKWLYDIHKNDKDFNDSRYFKDLVGTNGIIQDPIEYILKKIEPLSNEMKYNISISDKSFGKGWEAYRLSNPINIQPEEEFIQEVKEDSENNTNDKLVNDNPTIIQPNEPVNREEIPSIGIIQ